MPEIHWKWLVDLKWLFFIRCHSHAQGNWSKNGCIWLNISLFGRRCGYAPGKQRTLNHFLRRFLQRDSYHVMKLQKQQRERYQEENVVERPKKRTIIQSSIWQGSYKKIESDCREKVRAQLERMKELCREKNNLYEKQNELKGYKQKIEKSLEQ